MNNPESITGQYLSGIKQIPVPRKRRNGNGAGDRHQRRAAEQPQEYRCAHSAGQVCLRHRRLRQRQKHPHRRYPVQEAGAGTLTAAKSRPAIAMKFSAFEYIDKVINIDQSPIGRTPRSNPATYTGTFGPIRELFATVPEARMRGYAPGRFSFNVKGGRCEACRGEGYIEIEMQFLPDVTVPCEVCKGKRYNREALEIKFKDKNIAEVLDMTVEEALAFFEHFPQVKKKLETLNDVGLGYIRLGQPAPTLSGGEAQRVKLATELSRRATGRRSISWTSRPPAFLRRCGGFAEGAAEAGGRREYGGRHRAPPGCDEKRRLYHRPGARSRRKGRLRGRYGHAGAGGTGGRITHGTVPEANPFRQA